ncbi:MAG: biopolymer transporter ExbD [Blastocatellia bacterium]|nr:biopolymer transporter ExbD [Blastocatellia bacterium]
MNSQPRRAKCVPPAINVTPLIDVLLVLLIIFFVIQPHDEAKLPVRAPQPAPEESDPSPEMLMLTMSEDSSLALNTRPVTLEELLPLLASLMEERPIDSRTLLIKAPPRFAYQDVVLLIDLAKGAVVFHIGLIADES